MNELGEESRGGAFLAGDDISLREGPGIVRGPGPGEAEDWRNWLDRVVEIHRQILARRGGPLPDSTAEIAEDRIRDA